MQSFHSQVYVLTVASVLCFAQPALSQTSNPGSETPVATSNSATAQPSLLMSATTENTPGKKGKKAKLPKETPLTIEHGVLSIDGWPAKANLNYAISDIKYLYVWAPGIGTFVISNKEFSGATEVKDAFDAGTLTVEVDKHKVQVVSDRPMLSKKREPAYVALDSSSKDGSRYPRLGYGDVPTGPYSYPGSLVNTSAAEAEPPIPASMRPAVATKQVCETLSDGLQGDCKTMVLTMPATSAAKTSAIAAVPAGKTN